MQKKLVFGLRFQTVQLYLFSSIIGGLTAAAGIFMTNCFDMTDSIYGESCAMYLALARLNHSCCPNVQQTHYPDTTEEYLFAVRDINIGDEINDCYIELRQSKAERRASLLEFYRFECFCPGCCLPPDKEKVLMNFSDIHTLRNLFIFI